MKRNSHRVTGIRSEMARQFLWAVMILCAALPAFADEAADAIVGTWTTSGGRSQVEIYKSKNEYRAKIHSLKEPNYPKDDDKGMAGKPRVDRENPDPELRDRPLVGLEIMRNLKYAGENTWKKGRIYDPESGNTYRCTLQLVETNRLKLRGFVGVSILGRTEVWTR